MSVPRNTTPESRITALIRQKRRELKVLQREIVKLEVELNRYRRAGVAGIPVGRITTAKRLAVERAILNQLRRSIPPQTSGDQLWPIVQALGVSSRSTFRSHLKRMKDVGLVVSPSRGIWRLAPGVSTEVEMPRHEKDILIDVDLRSKREPGPF